MFLREQDAYKFISRSLLTVDRDQCVFFFRVKFCCVSANKLGNFWKFLFSWCEFN
jgi:hypothetical protein